MANLEKDTADVVVLPADKSLFNKIGGVSLDKIIPQQLIQKADSVIADASDELYLDCIAESVKLQALVSQLSLSDPNIGPRLKRIVSAAFGIKNRASQSGYTLVASLAESLQTHCESVDVAALTPNVLRIVVWHAHSIAQLLAKKVRADGGDVGKAILAEVQKIRA